VKLLGISKRGGLCLRAQLIHSARSVLEHDEHLNEQLQHLLARKLFNAAVVTLASKVARTTWALLADGRTYQPGYAAPAA